MSAVLPGNVKCDACGWTKPVDDILACREDACPVCATPLMDAYDKAQMDAFIRLYDAGVVVGVRASDPVPADSLRVLFDTAPDKRGPV